MAQIPVHVYPSGRQIQIPMENVTFKWIDPLGGGILPGPITYGTIKPNGKVAHHGIATIATDGHVMIEYYFCK
jgi:hypothetical protein